MKFSDFFNRDADHNIAAQLKAATKITMGDAVRDRMRANLSEYARMRPIRSAPLRTERTYDSFFMRRAFQMPAIALALIVVIGGGTVSKAESALPGDILYPIKVHFSEEIQAAIAVSPKAQAEWAVARAERRLEEAAALELAGTLEAHKAEIDSNLSAHLAQASEDQQTLENTNDAEATNVGENIDAVRFARENILGATVANAKTAQELHARDSDVSAFGVPSPAAPPPQAALMEAPEQPRKRAKAAPLPTLMSTDAISTEVPKMNARGKRAAAKIRIEAARKYLDSHKELDEKAQSAAHAQLRAAAETLSSGDEKSSRGDTEDAASEFEHALKTATELHVILRGKREE